MPPHGNQRCCEEQLCPGRELPKVETHPGSLKQTKLTVPVGLGLLLNTRRVTGLKFSARKRCSNITTTYESYDMNYPKKNMNTNSCPAVRLEGSVTRPRTEAPSPTSQHNKSWLTVSKAE